VYLKIVDWQPGKVIDRKYRIEKVLGRGGFGITYKAKHLTLGSFCVIKTPRTEFRQDNNYREFVYRFYKEAKTLASLKPHPHIVRVFDLFEEPDEDDPRVKIPCLMMEFIEGKSLFNLVKDGGALPENEAVGYIQQIGSALMHIHKTGLVHFDATPMNIMIRPDGTAVLIDFGIAGDCPPSSISLQTGNPAFAPYEQFLGERNVTVDIYTLAAGLYYAVMGECPTPSTERLKKVPLIEPKSYKSISPSLNYAIVWGMALEAGKRPQSIQKWLGLPCFSRDIPDTVRMSELPEPENKGWDWSWLPWVNGSVSPVPQSTVHQLPISAPKSKINKPLASIPGLNVYQPQEDDLRSERGVDYTLLQRLLQQQRWKDADDETYRRMLEAVKREKESYFRLEDLKNFPCIDLKTIDQLWVKYSRGRFGFSVQKRIWLDLGGTLDDYDYDTFIKLGDRVGWRKNGSLLNYSDYIFTTNALQGHLPASAVWGLAVGEVRVGSGGVGVVLCILFSLL